MIFRGSNTATRSIYIAAITLNIVVTAVLLSACINDDNETPEQTTLVACGQSAPDFTTQMIDGDKTTLSDLRGKVVLLTFFDIECSMCRAEMAVVQQRIIERFDGLDFVYLPVSRGSSRDALVRFMTENGYTYPIAIDTDRSVYGLYATKFVPRSFVIDRTGVIRLICVEYQLDELETITDTVEELL